MINDRGYITMRSGDQREGLQDLINDLTGVGLVMVEIGCYAGESSLMFLQSGKVSRFYAIDTWKSIPDRVSAEKEFDRVTAPYVVIKYKGDIDRHVARLPELDLAYIDGSHHYKDVKNDIVKILPKIKKGGIIAGHDYSDQYKDRVMKAVHEELGKPDKVYKDTSWIKYL